MAVYNAAPFLREAVESVLSQTLTDFELLAVDDASSDNSRSILSSIKDERLRVIVHGVNQGAANSRNHAFAVARGEYVAIMDADDVSASNRFERQVRCLDARPEVGVVGCGVFDNIDVDGSVLYTSYLPLDDASIQQTLLERWCFLHPSLMFRRSLLAQVPGYRPEFDVAEDHDFILRLLSHCEARNLNEKLVAYRINPRGLSVVSHRYINELGAAAMRLAQARRRGEREDLEGEVRRLRELKERFEHSQVRKRIFNRWRNSLYAANRLYGFGCLELYAGRRERARRCFIRSLKTNALFAKAWVCLVLSFLPIASSRLGFVFRASRHHFKEVDAARGSQIGEVRGWPSSDETAVSK
jgi:glycosyltransferase involved in cell wall biosynthesis